MSPLHVRIMLHYSYSVVDWSDPSSASRSYIADFIECGMLSENNHALEHSTTYAITPKGKAYVEKICSIPIPAETTTYSFPVENEE